MRLAVVTGGRGYEPTRLEHTALAEALDEYRITHVMHGGCKGVDTWGGHLAESLDRWVIVVPAPWMRMGNPAGPTRNAQMVELANILMASSPHLPLLVALPGGKGTASMRRLARRSGWPVKRLGHGGVGA